MGNKRYVQHISGQGEKWEVLNDNQHCHESEWRVKAKDHAFYHDIPKSEYRLCEPPEEWEDITRECEWTHECYSSWYIKAANGDRIEAYMNGPYRVRKIDLLYEHCNHACAFIVERRKP